MMVRSAAALALTGLIALTMPAVSQSRRPLQDDPQGVHRPDNPNEGLQPNGCVKLCPLDTNPCDPPEYKRADGRCTLKD